jgi:hypothetical protein
MDKFMNQQDRILEYLQSGKTLTRLNSWAELEWAECGESGNLKAEGDKGAYWIYENSTQSVELFHTYEFRNAIEEQRLGGFDDVDSAKAAAEKFDGCAGL